MNLSVPPPFSSHADAVPMFMQCRNGDFAREDGAKSGFTLIEQLRSSLGMENALPFLEKEGNYWGTPEDDWHRHRRA